MSGRDYINALSGAVREPYKNYWRALGEFIHHFSYTERSMQSFLRHVAGTSDVIGRAAFSGVKVDAAMSLCNRILEATGKADLKARIEPVFQQLGIINGIRNNMVHWGASDAGNDDFRVTNSFYAATPDRVTEFSVSLIELNAMMADLMKIDVHLGWEAAIEKSEINEHIERALRPTLEAAWLYKQRPRPTQPKDSRKSAPKRQRQRASSRQTH
jgi:hypothetical protein